VGLHLFSSDVSNKIKYGGSKEVFNKCHQIKLLSYDKIINHVNPTFVTRQIITPKGNMTLIDEGVLIGGSKQRVMPMVLSQIEEKKIIYAGPSTGYAQIALAYVCLMMGKQAILFLDCTKYDKSPLTDIAKKFGAVVFYFDQKIKEKRLQYITKQADLWNKKNKDSYILPFGLNDTTTIQLYSRSFQALKKLTPKRLWIVAGSGLIFTALSKILVDTKFMIIQVGKKIWPDQLEGIDHQLFISEYKFKESIDGEVPYDTLLNYDAKAYPFILKYGRAGDFIWNTASSPKPLHVYDNEICKIEDMKETYSLDKYMFTPKHKLSMNEVSKMFDDLTDIALKWNPTNIVNRNFTNDYYNIDGISNHFTEEIRMNCVVNRSMKLSPKQFLDKNKCNIATKSIFLYGGYTLDSKLYYNKSDVSDVNKNLLDTLALINGYRECNSFNPLILINFIKRYFKNWKTVNLLDPSMGWGDRLLACLALGIKSYTGFDPNLKLHPCYNEIKKMNTTTKTKFIADKFSSKKLNDKFDVVFTSPPFFNFEIYNYSEEDNSGSYDTWLSSIYEPYLNDMIKSVNNGGYIGVYIDNIGKFKISDVTNKILNSKLKFVEKLIFQNDYYDFNELLHIGTPRSLLVYKNINV
jgi:hypothetical protein